MLYSCMSGSRFAIAMEKFDITWLYVCDRKVFCNFIMGTIYKGLLQDIGQTRLKLLQIYGRCNQTVWKNNFNK